MVFGFFSYFLRVIELGNNRLRAVYALMENGVGVGDTPRMLLHGGSVEASRGTRDEALQGVPTFLDEDCQGRKVGFMKDIWTFVESFMLSKLLRGREERHSFETDRCCAEQIGLGSR